LNAPLHRAGEETPRSRKGAASTTTKGQTMSTKTPSLPSHRVYAVTKGEKKNFWREIGVVFAHKDGEGFNLKLNFLPLNGAEIVIRKPKDEEAEAASDAE
jgi:hypothetical protein